MAGKGKSGGKSGMFKSAGSGNAGNANWGAKKKTPKKGK